MRLEAAFAALVLFGDCTLSAQADLRAAPRFSAAETQTIARNELLNAVVAADPWLVRRMLDLLARGRAGGSAGAGAPAAADPDLVAPRDWQGIVEWNELVKRARAEKEAREKPSPVAASRSSEGTVELLDMMRRAKAKKDSAGAR